MAVMLQLVSLPHTTRDNETAAIVASVGLTEVVPCRVNICAAIVVQLALLRLMITRRRRTVGDMTTMCSRWKQASAAHVDS